MNRDSRRLTKRQAEQKARRMIASVHFLIAVVAIIECLLLVTFTTFSWIESNSSLVIRNGPESSQVNTNISKKMDIASQLASKINLNYSSEEYAPLNDFFSIDETFRFAKATSSDGRTMFFPCKNNTNNETGKYRKGDTIDYNTSYIYLDFILSNKGTGAENRDIYFDNSTGYTDIFDVAGDGLTNEQKAALTKAMRMSITTQVGATAPSTHIYSKVAYTADSEATYKYKSFDAIPADQSYAYDTSGEDNDRNTWVGTNDIGNYVYSIDETNNVIQSEKLFVARKNADTKVSIRIWFEFFDPDFRSEFGLDNGSFDYSSTSSAYAKLPKADIKIKFRLMTSGNDLRSLYFDDYTFSNNGGINVNHLTDEPDNDDNSSTNYSVWFYAWQPAVSADLASGRPARAAGYFAYELDPDRSNPEYTRWTTNFVTASTMDYLRGVEDYANATGFSGEVSERYQKSYFCYGDFSTQTAVYKWEIPSAPKTENYVFTAYSYQPNSLYTPAASADGWNDCVASASGTRLGAGIWQDDDEYTTLTMLKFKDEATAATSGNYNSGNDNFQIMKAAAVADNHVNYLVYANNYNSDTLADNFTGSIADRVDFDDTGEKYTTINASSVAQVTAAMYYDATEQVFKSYVPSYWLKGDGRGTANGTKGVSFTYCPTGSFSADGATLRWYNNSPVAVNGEYVFTALGNSNRVDVSDLTGVGYLPDFFSASAGFLKGVGTWGETENVFFCTDLIDADLSSSYRYYIGIGDSYSAGYYVMRPNAANMTFTARIPKNYASSSALIKFVRYDAVKTESSDAPPTMYWYPNVRSTYTTYYPVNFGGTAGDTTEYTHGYWNLSVLVDGTYENLIYDTLTDGAVYGGVTPDAYAPTVDDSDITGYTYTVDYRPRDNYGLLEYSYDGTAWVTLADDTTDTFNNRLNGPSGTVDRYRFYVPAEGHDTVYWRWTPYAAFSVTAFSGVAEHEVTIAGEATVFRYTHDVSNASANGIYHVVTESPYIPASYIAPTEAPTEAPEEP